MGKEDLGGWVRPGDRSFRRDRSLPIDLSCEREPPNWLGERSYKNGEAFPAFLARRQHCRKCRKWVEEVVRRYAWFARAIWTYEQGRMAVTTGIGACTVSRRPLKTKEKTQR